ncbi:MAG: NTP transferase domain-containing protein [Opitutales bacterium]|nr:NTP transferase domain-containing protein [Opitutales bacterium]
MSKLKTAFVLGAGLGTRLRPLTLDTPKPMLPVGGKPLIEHIFGNLAAAGFEQIIVNTHHAAQKYAQYFSSPKFKGASLRFVHEEELLDTGGGLKNILDFIDFESGALVYNGDIFWEGDIKKFADFFEKCPCPAALALREEGANKNVSVRQNRVCDMRFALGAEFEKTMQFTGIFACRKEFLEIVKKRPEKNFSTVEALLELIKKSPGSVAAYTDNSPWTDIGTIAEYEKIK